MTYIIPQKCLYLFTDQRENLGWKETSLNLDTPFVEIWSWEGENPPSLTGSQIHFWQHWDNVPRGRVDFPSAMVSKSGLEGALLLWQVPRPSLCRWSDSTGAVLPSGLPSIYTWLNFLQVSFNSSHEQFHLFTPSIFVHCLLSCNNGYATQA